MKQTESLSTVGRRVVAIAAWILPALLTAFVPDDVSDAIVVTLLILISVTSAISLLLMGDDLATDSPRVQLVRSAPFAIALAIPAACAFVLNSRSSWLTTLTLSALSIFPPLVASLVVGRQTRFRLSAPNAHPLKSSPIIERPSTGQVPFDASMEPEENSAYVFGLVSDDETPIPKDVTQWLTRASTPDGEMIEGAIRVEFQQGQRDVTAHLSFCPPLVNVPQVETEDLDGADLEIRVAAVFKFGARLTVRRQQSINSKGEKFAKMSCRVGFVAMAAPSRRIA